MPQLVKFESFREYMFRTISQITLNYRGKGLDQGHVGPVHGGDRLPWVKLGAGDNYASFNEIGWQIHVYGTAGADLASWCEGRGVRLANYPWRDEMSHAGLRENALYLVRPDTYVALAEAHASVAAVETFLASVNIKP